MGPLDRTQTGTGYVHGSVTVARDGSEQGRQTDEMLGLLTVGELGDNKATGRLGGCLGDTGLTADSRPLTGG